MLTTIGNLPAFYGSTIVIVVADNILLKYTYGNQY
jgi:hypothetical protein